MVPGSFGWDSAVFAAIVTLAPSRAHFSAIASPMPREAPVTNRVLLLRDIARSFETSAALPDQRIRVKPPARPEPDVGSGAVVPEGRKKLRLPPSWTSPGSSGQPPAPRASGGPRGKPPLLRRSPARAPSGRRGGAGGLSGSPPAAWRQAFALAPRREAGERRPARRH